MRVGFLVVFMVPFVLCAQMFGELEKTETTNNAQTLLDISVGYGFAFYDYDTNNSTGSKYDLRESAFLQPIPIEISVLRRTNKILFGTTLEYSNFLNNDSSYLLPERAGFQMLQLSARFDVPLTESAAGAAYLGLNIGSGLVMNAPGSGHSPILVVAAHSTLLRHLKDDLSLLFKFTYGLRSFNSQINSTRSAHQLLDMTMTLGLRFGL